MGARLSHYPWIIWMLLAAVIAAGALAAIGILPLNNRPVGTNPIKLGERLWLDCDYDGVSDKWYWNLVVTSHGGAIASWDKLVAGSVIAKRVTGYSLINPGLVVIRESDPQREDRWIKVGISAANYNLNSFNSESALNDALVEDGLSQSLRWQKPPKVSSVTEGEVFLEVVLSVVVMVYLLSVLFGKSMFSMAREHGPVLLGPGGGSTDAHR